MHRHKALMIPGPTEVAVEVLERMSRPVEPHYGEEFVRLYFGVESKLKKVFQTRNDIYTLAATSSAAMEAAITAGTEPGDEVLVCHNGFFGARFAEIVASAGGRAVLVRAEFGQPIRPAEVEAALRDHPGIRLLALVHNETSTGVENPVREIVAIARKRKVLTVVDSVSALGGVPLPVDKWGIDFCVSGSQKCLESPAGLSFISVSERAWKFMAARKTPVAGWYLNLLTLRRYRREWIKWHPQGPNTAPVSLYMALDAALDRILAEGLEKRFARHARAAKAVRSAVRAVGIKPFVADACASKTLTALKMPKGIDGVELRKRMAADHQILLAGGVGGDESIVRISHMGLTASAEFQVPTMAALERCLALQGMKVKPGQAVRKFEEVFGAQ
jgi:alanine-glyoxylate transaminase/serine-glyoxylate transaminase/serine-pyruvate transaminase